jgi:hypothetical protein
VSCANEVFGAESGVERECSGILVRAFDVVGCDTLASPAAPWASPRTHDPVTTTVSIVITNAGRQSERFFATIESV